MKKTGSILIWTIFLGLFVAVFFVAFQSRLERYISGANANIWDQENQENIAEALQKASIRPQANIAMDDGWFLRAIGYDNVSFQTVLGQNEATEFRITDTGSETNLVFTIKQGGPLKYRLIDTTSGVHEIASGTILTGATVSNVSGSGVMYVENLGGYADFSLYTGNAQVTPPSMVYQFFSQNWANQMSWKIYDIWYFLKKQAFPGVDYATGLYLNAQ